MFLAALFIIALCVVRYLSANLDPLVKASIEKYGSETIQSEVRLGSVHISPTTGEGTMTGLSVHNPQGFSDANAIYVETVKLS